MKTDDVKERNEEPSELERLLATMDLPINKKRVTPQNVKWLMSNMAIRNSGHANYVRARELLVAEGRKLNVLDKRTLHEEKQQQQRST